MRFALNYSPEAAQLLEDEIIQVDLFKLPAWDSLIVEVSASYPVYVHFPLTAGSPSAEPVDFALVERYLRETESTYVNVHLGVSHQKTMPQADILDLSQPMIDDVTERMSRDLHDMVARFGAENVIAENLFCLDRSGQPMQACTLPDVITHVIEDAGCGLLLDVAHAQVAAFTFGMRFEDYVSALPVDRLREVHVTGIGYRDDGRLGDHLPMRSIDWAAYEWVMDQVHHNPDWAQPNIVACEYGGIGELFRLFTDADTIAHQIPRMYRSVYPQGTPVT